MMVIAINNTNPPPTAELISVEVASYPGSLEPGYEASVKVEDDVTKRSVLAGGIITPPVLQQSSDKFRKETSIDGLLQTGRKRPICPKSCSCCTAIHQSVLHTTSER